ncbi:MAG: hypothetical protein LBF22_05350 [Deltaproteobacteria bacterium]|nr:hypothetical protein [Deltaproteobacteria bacterium]
MKGSLLLFERLSPKALGPGNQGTPGSQATRSTLAFLLGRVRTFKNYFKNPHPKIQSLGLTNGYKARS